MSERKMVSRNVAVALGIICIILVAGLGGAMAYYVSYVSTHGHVNSEYDALQSKLDDIAFLNRTDVWLNNDTRYILQANTITPTFSADYAGYISVSFTTATVLNNAFVEVSYSSKGVDYDNRVRINGNSTEVFPVLPSIVTVAIGNLDYVQSYTCYLTIIYHY